MIAILFLVLNILFGFLIFYLLIAFLTGAPFVPSTKLTANAMIRLADINKNSIVYDLGSGDGRLLNLSMRHGAKKAIGYEINPYLVLVSRMRFFFSPYRKTIDIYLNNFWHADIKDADIVFIYLLPWRMDALKQKLVTELKPGARVVSNSFIFPNWNVVRSDKKSHVYVFGVPHKAPVELS